MDDTPEQLPEAAQTQIAYDEALRQIELIYDDEEERRKTTDIKLGTAQNAIGFSVVLAGGSFAITLLQNPVYDIWHVFATLALMIGVGFFVWAGVQVIAAYNPRSYQHRTVDGVIKILRNQQTKQALQEDAFIDIRGNVKVNQDITDERLTLYRAAIENLRKGIIAIGLVPAIIFIAYVVNALFRDGLPPWAQLKNQTISSSSRATSSNSVIPNTPSVLALPPRQLPK